MYRSCTSCRNARQALSGAEVAVDVREYFTQPFTVEELSHVLRRGGLAATDVLSTRSKSYREQGIDARELGDDALIDEMIAEPRLIKRPILVTDGNVYIGFNHDTYRELTAALVAENE
jgi:Spx/MgsR family transcriptional regulator